jgi:Putative peptidoglycan binding domain
VTATMDMFDAIEDDQYPQGAAAYAGYVDGHLGDQPDYAYIVKAFPSARHLSIAISPADDAACLDIENGAATPQSAAAWYLRQKARGITRPCFYASTSVMQANVVPVITASGIGRASVRLWTAHYGQGEHICGPSSCGLLAIDADGTQWTDQALGRNLDQSLLAGDFFGTPVPAAVPAWEEAFLQHLPLVTEGYADAETVRTAQGLLCARGHATAVDGAFGPETLAAVQAFQTARGLSPDGKAGPLTWAALLAV